MNPLLSAKGVTSPPGGRLKILPPHSRTLLEQQPDPGVSAETVF
jgi:hypothetical protein